MGTTVPGNPQAACTARRFLRATLAQWAVPGFTDRLVDDATLLISELVTNAVVHAGTAADVLCRLDSGLVIEVSDRHPTRMLRREDDDHRDEGGRGLHLVAELSDEWGITYRPDRKTVWCRLAVEDAREDAREDVRGRATRQATVDVPDQATAPQALPPQHPAPENVPAPRAPAELLAPDPAQAPRRADAEWISRGSLSFLAEASDLLAGQLDEENVAVLATQLLVPRLADWCAVWLYPAGAAPRLSHVWHSEEHRIDGLRAVLDKSPPEPTTRPGARRTPWPLMDDDAPRGQGGAPRRADARAPGAGGRGTRPPAEGGGTSRRRQGESRKADQSLPRADTWVPGVGVGGTRPPAEGGRTDQALSVPLVAAGRCHGTLLLGRTGPLGLADELIHLVEDFARRVALALGTARQYARQAMISTVLQRGLLPPAAGRIPGVEHAVVYEPLAGDWVGGDFYDLFPAGDGRWCFALGDVCGNGPEAASLTGIARPVLRLLAREGYGVSDVLDRLNKALADEAATALIGGTAAWEDGQPRFLSLLYGEIVPYAPGYGAGCTLASAGHPLPLVLASDGTVRPAAAPQMLLGISDDVRYTSETLDLAPGDTLLCVTDGVTERRRGHRQFDDADGLARALRACAGLRAADVADRIRQAVHDYDTTPPDDDLAVLVLQAR
ncbi:SpoIIE family protein phosphatase [Streptomyces sp.]|uniref:SpoIIE family protein phosphatase n=1 Tax=Streptomyces sp. TaxID=1931 RepID=UPI002F412F85